MTIDENTRLIDLKVSDLITILQESTPARQPAIPEAGDDEIGGYEIAEKITGYARQTLYQLKSAGEIPYISLPNGGVRFSRKEIVAWLMAHKRLTNSEIADRATHLVFKRRLRRKQ